MYQCMYMYMYRCMYGYILDDCIHVYAFVHALHLYANAYAYIYTSTHIFLFAYYVHICCIQVQHSANLKGLLACKCKFPLLIAST